MDSGRCSGSFVHFLVLVGKKGRNRAGVRVRRDFWAGVVAGADGFISNSPLPLRVYRHEGGEQSGFGGKLFGVNKGGFVTGCALASQGALGLFSQKGQGAKKNVL